MVQSFRQLGGERLNGPFPAMVSLAEISRIYVRGILKILEGHGDPKPSLFLLES